MFATFINPFPFSVSIVGTFTNGKPIPITELKCVKLSDGLHTYHYVNGDDIVTIPNKLHYHDTIGNYYIEIKDGDYELNWLKQAFEIGDEDIYGAYYLHIYYSYPHGRNLYHKDALEKAKLKLANGVNYGCVYSMFQLANLYKNELYNYSAATKLYEMASNLGHLEASDVLVKQEQAKQKQIKENEKILNSYITMGNIGDSDAIRYLIKYYELRNKNDDVKKWKTKLMNN